MDIVDRRRQLLDAPTGNLLTIRIILDYCLYDSRGYFVDVQPLYRTRVGSEGQYAMVSGVIIMLLAYQKLSYPLCC